MTTGQAATFTEAAAIYQTADTIRIEVTAVHIQEHRRLHARLRELEQRREAGENVGDTSPIRRALRQEAQTILACISGLEVRSAKKAAITATAAAANRWAGLLDDDEPATPLAHG